jgi:hypothetical protein
VDEVYSVLLAGLKAPEEHLVSGHFLKSGYRIITAEEFVDAEERTLTLVMNRKITVPLAGSGCEASPAFLSAIARFMK